METERSASRRQASPTDSSTAGWARCSRPRLDGAIRVLLVNRGDAARTATVGGAQTAVTVFDNPHHPPHALAPSDVVTLPPRSIVLVER